MHNKKEYTIRTTLCHIFQQKEKTDKRNKVFSAITQPNESYTQMLVFIQNNMHNKKEYTELEPPNDTFSNKRKLMKRLGQFDCVNCLI